MCKRIILLLILLFLSILAACGEQSGDSLQGQSGMAPGEMTDEGYMQTRNTGPIIFDEFGEKQLDQDDADHSKMARAAESVAGVRVQTITFEDDQATVTVSVNEQLNSGEKMAKINHIRSAIEGEVPNYQIKVLVK
ncbi:hypothetical protein [Sediminibacillus albus]|uniref:Sporulation lipoprotein YhcN/YlaJ (Spore_YhcN_YlaJ) n=1 Tax=Sediminibacillus albus TaxID=407036 RepID=A0A1G8ZKE9_9BACI|nr:hypothetical protein [Sediminibacillus albus]SDK15508.1 hypothetical protein SAMN05216243_2072 [Sediminibacillus albus]